jgi:hypothetical protein
MCARGGFSSRPDAFNITEENMYVSGELFRILDAYVRFGIDSPRLRKINNRYVDSEHDLLDPYLTCRSHAEFSSIWRSMTESHMRMKYGEHEFEAEGSPD